MGHEFEDVKVAQGKPRGAGNLFHQADAALAVDEGPFLFAPAGSRQNQVRPLRRLRGGEHFLHDEELQSAGKLVELPLINPRMRSVGGDDPETFDLIVGNALNNLIVSP